MPYYRSNVFLRQDNLVSPLKSEYLRENSAELSFKYGKGSPIRVTVLGRATRKFDSYNIDALSQNSLFSQLGESMSGLVDEFITGIEAIKKSDQRSLAVTVRYS